MQNQNPKIDVIEAALNDDDNDRTFTIESLKQPVRYNIRTNTLLIDEGMQDINDPVSALDSMQSPNMVWIGEHSTHPYHQQVWKAAIPQMNEFRAKEGLPPIGVENNNVYDSGLNDVFSDDPAADNPAPPGFVATPDAGAHVSMGPPPPMPIDPLRFAHLELANKVLIAFLKKHLKAEDPDWIILGSLIDDEGNLR